MFYIPLVKNKCQAEGIIAFLHHNIPNFANLMSSLHRQTFVQNNVNLEQKLAILHSGMFAKSNKMLLLYLHRFHM